MNKYTLLQLVSEVTGIETNKICGRSRQRDIVTARHIYFYFGRFYFGLKLIEMSKLIGCHHASVIHACLKVQDMLTIDDPIYSKAHDLVRCKITEDREVRLLVPYSVNLAELIDHLAYFPSIRLIAEA
jgi:chromosomal replication initiation ATPase DnaA